MRQYVSRRNFVKAAALGSGAAVVSLAAPVSKRGAKSGPFARVKLPYARDGLEPHVSAKTIALHYGKHHKRYVDDLNARLSYLKLSYGSLQDVIRKNRLGDPKQESIHRMAVLAWNHNFYWQSMSPRGGGKPQGKLGKAVAASFGDYEKLRERYQREAGRIGTGWVWLVADGGKLDVVSTNYNKTVLPEKATPLLALDVWEHAYYLDYRAEKRKYVTAFLDNLANWDFAENNLG